MRSKMMALAVAALVALPVMGARQLRATTGPGHVVVIKMVKQGGSDYRFSPATITVQPGDTIRWVQESDAPHNVQFDSWAKGAKIGSVQMGPFLTSTGQTYQLLIDGRFAPGKYVYECTPHGAMGMKASLTVAAAAQ